MSWLVDTWRLGTIVGRHSRNTYNQDTYWLVDGGTNWHPVSAEVYEIAHKMAQRICALELPPVIAPVNEELRKEPPQAFELMPQWCVFLWGVSTGLAVWSTVLYCTGQLVNK